MKKALSRRLFVALLFFASGCGGRLFYSDGPYLGRVIDRESKQPIEGAAVVAVWWKETPMVVDYTVTYYDAQETLTDKEGNFTILGIVGGSVNPLVKIRAPVFTIFKPGYKAYGGWSITPRSLPDGIRLYEEDGRTVIELSPLRRREERVENLSAAYLAPDVPEEKYPNLTRLKNIERKELGFRN